MHHTSFIKYNPGYTPGLYLYLPVLLLSASLRRTLQVSVLYATICKIILI